MPQRHQYFVATQQRDGQYSVLLTEEGMQQFETALGIAEDLGRGTRISPYSTIADIMERTAARQELSDLLRQPEPGPIYRIRLCIARRRLVGSERPEAWQRTAGHIGKALVVGAVFLWAAAQFWIAIADVAAIPGILAGLPLDLLHLHPQSTFEQVGANISDAGHHLVTGLLGLVATMVAARLVRPLQRIYRKDQITPGARQAMKLLEGAARRLHAASRARPRAKAWGERSAGNRTRASRPLFPAE